jgi:hypothetical protein
MATIGIAVVGLVVAVGLLVNGVRSARRVASEVTSVEPGQSGLVTFEAPGSFTLYYAGPPKAVVAADMRALARDVQADLRPRRGGPAVVMHPYENEQLGITTTADGQVVALSTFSIQQAGDYVLRTDPIRGVDSSEARIVVGKSLYQPLARGAIAALISIAVSAVLSLVATIALAVTRGRAKRARTNPPSPPGPWGGAPVWPTAPPQWAGPPPIVPPPPPGYGARFDLGRSHPAPAAALPASPGPCSLLGPPSAIRLAFRRLLRLAPAQRL